MRKAFILDSSEYWAGVLRAHLHRYEIEVSGWYPKATGWVDPLRAEMPHYLFVEDQIASGSGLKCIENMGNVLRRGMKVVFQHSLQGIEANQIEAQALAMGAHCILRKPYRVQEIKRIAFT